MSYVMFATVCDRCKSRGWEYMAHTIRCRECMDDVCQKCAAEFNEDGPDSSALCKECAKFCACGVELLTEAEERNRVCRMCL